jgi:hypothetical protein
LPPSRISTANSMKEPPNPNFSKLSLIDETILGNNDLSQ